MTEIKTKTICPSMTVFTLNINGFMAPASFPVNPTLKHYIRYSLDENVMATTTKYQKVEYFL